MTRKVAGLLISFVLLFAMAGCGNNVSSDKSNSVPTSSATQTQEEQITSHKESETEIEENSELSTSDLEPERETNMKNSILVVYFSATGTTEAIAEQAAEILDSDLYEIVPEDPYTEEDLAYYTSGRADQEQEDPNARPVISDGVENMRQYDIILLGYPIWHGQAPRIINTFLESYDFSGKTVIPFCTSHSSGVGSSAENLHELCSDMVNWIEGSRFAGGTSREEIENWISSVLPDAIY